MSTDCDPGIMMPDHNPIKRDDGRERKHRTTQEARKALSNFCKAAWGDRAGIHIFTIPVDNERDADCILSDVIEERDRLRAAIERSEDKIQWSRSSHKGDEIKFPREVIVAAANGTSEAGDAEIEHCLQVAAHWMREEAAKLADAEDGRHDPYCCDVLARNIALSIRQIGKA